MLDELKKQVCNAARRLCADERIDEIGASVSGIDRQSGHIVITPAGMDQENLAPENMVILSLEGRSVVESEMNPTRDASIHIEVYRAFRSMGFEDIAGLVHSQSLCATAWAQAKSEIPVFGTIHADVFYGAIPCTREMTSGEIVEDYERNIGKLINETFQDIDPMQIKAVLLADHGPCTWGTSPTQAVDVAIMLERVARLASETLRVDPYPHPINRELLDKHFLRKSETDFRNQKS